MSKHKKIVSQLLSLSIFLFLIISITIPVYATEGNQYGQGSGQENDPTGNNHTQQNSQSGSQNQQQNQNQGSSQQTSGNGQGQNQNQQCQNQNGTGFQRRYQNRKLNCTGENNRSRIRSQWNLNKSQDAFEIDFITHPIPTLTMKYMPTGEETDIQLTFTINVNKIIEFTDENGNERYDHSDTIESIYELKDIDFTDIEYTSSNQTTNKSLLQMKTTTIDKLLTMELIIADNFTTFKNQFLTPAEMKIDFTIQNYSYTTNTSYLTLFIEIITEHNLSVQSESFDEKQGYATNESAMNISSNKYSGFFSWINNVIVDGEIKPIQSSYLKEEFSTNQTNEKIQYISFTYPHGTTIIHDPKIGVISQSFTTNPENGISLIETLTGVNIYFSYIISVVLAAILFFGIIIIRKRI